MSALFAQPRPLVVVTGGLGRVATAIRPHLAMQYRVRLVDRVHGVTADGVEIVVADLAAPGAAEDVLAGAEAVVHLAGQGDPRLGWEQAYQANVVPARMLLDAAENLGPPKVVLASSVHVLGEYNRPGYRPVQPDWAPRPCCAYGLSKVAVELLGRRYAERTGASVVALRLGLLGWPLVEARYLGMWLSAADGARAVTAALAGPRGFGVHFAISANTRRHWDITSATRDLGYRPRDDSESFAAKAGPPAEQVCRLFGSQENPKPGTPDQS